MKVVFSRKGFDSTAGGFPSLIFPDGTIFSIPIPSRNDKYKYKELNFHYEDESIQSILNDLTNNQIRNKNWLRCDYNNSEQCCHYDPLSYSEPAFTGITLGQANASEKHLRNQNIGTGDIFLFYGWFREVNRVNGTWTYTKNSPDIHLIWSYMSIGDIVRIDTIRQQQSAIEKYPFLLSHPHIGDPNGQSNSIYLSDKYRYFEHNQTRCLTDTIKYRGRATWRLPRFFDQKDAFSYLNNFTADKNDVVISYRGYGQEFVLDLDKIRSNEDKEKITAFIKKITSSS